MKAFNRALIAFLIDNLLSYYLLSIIFIFYLHDVFPSLDSHIYIVAVNAEYYDT